MEGVVISHETIQALAKVIVDEVRKQLKESCVLDELTKQEPCEDCISREAVLLKIGKYQLVNKWENLIKAIEDLPSVKPTKPRGEENT